jgi:hypothetical protein
VRAGQSAVIHCDQSGSYELTGCHAAVNGVPRDPDHLVSAPQEKLPHDHAHDHGAGDHHGHDHAGGGSR